jgi:tight adherence protein C
VPEVSRAVVLAAVGAALGGWAGLDLLLSARGSRRRRPARTREGSAVAALVALGRRIGVPAAPADLARRLAAAGSPRGLRVADVMAAKGAGAVLGAAGSVPWAAALPGRLGVLALAAGPAAGFLAPDLWLARRARRRAAAMQVELADVVDLMRVPVEAGLSVPRALEEVGRRRAGLLAAELRACTAAISLGVPRAEALAQLRARCPVDGIGPLVAAIERADRHGAPLGPALVSLAADARADRARAVGDRAARAAPKIQLVVALLLVPSVMLFVAAALVSALR